MIEHLATLVEAERTPLAGRNLAREYLQARILESLQRAGAMIPLAFLGGTALRFLYGTRRYSEDLDFALERDPARYDLRGYLRAVRSDLEPEGYDLTLRLNDGRPVHSAWIRFPGLLYALGLSPQRTEALAIKLEVDTRPPAGAGLATTVVRRHAILHLQHHDRASLLAGKLHAVLQRRYTKGRDLYDLVWYLSDPAWPAPNLTLLNQALRQTDWPGPALEPATWHRAVRARLADVDWGRARDDVLPFLERPADADLLTADTMDRLLRHKEEPA